MYKPDRTAFQGYRAASGEFSLPIPLSGHVIFITLTCGEGGGGSRNCSISRQLPPWPGLRELSVACQLAHPTILFRGKLGYELCNNLTFVRSLNRHDTSDSAEAATFAARPDVIERCQYLLGFCIDKLP